MVRGREEMTGTGTPKSPCQGGVQKVREEGGAWALSARQGGREDHRQQVDRVSGSGKLVPVPAPHLPLSPGVPPSCSPCPHLTASTVSGAPHRGAQNVPTECEITWGRPAVTPSQKVHSLPPPGRGGADPALSKNDGPSLLELQSHGVGTLQVYRTSATKCPLSLPVPLLRALQLS
jgi:hypothetical protein